MVEYGSAIHNNLGFIGLSICSSWSFYTLVVLLPLNAFCPWSINLFLLFLPASLISYPFSQSTQRIAGFADLKKESRCEKRESRNEKEMRFENLTFVSFVASL
jgi:hypothetical protein